MMKRPQPPDIETKLIIVGAGVTGIALSQKLLESNIDFWLLGSPYESQLAKAGRLENTPLPEGTIGLKFIEQQFELLKSSGIQHRSSLCTGIEQQDGGFLVKTKFQNFKSEYVVIATGAKQKALGFEGEDKYFKKGISDCTVCDYPLYRDSPVAVLGNHEYTIRAAKLMREHTENVSLLWYHSENIPNLEGIDVYSNVRNLQAFGDDGFLGKIKFEHNAGQSELKIQGLFVEGEPVPSTSFLTELDLEHDNGYLKVDSNFQTNISKLWAAGDITGKTSNYKTATDAGVKLAEILIQELT